MERKNIRDKLHVAVGGKPKIHILYGPRHVGKTRFLREFLETVEKDGAAAHSFSADSIATLPPEWMESRWKEAVAAVGDHDQKIVLAFDEIQNVGKFRETVYRLFYEERANARRVHVILTISASPMVSDLLAEWLVDEVETHVFTQWSFSECRETFGITIDDYLFYGGYPGALAEWKREGGGEGAWRDYLRDGVLESVIGRDIHRFQCLSKPELFRKTAQLALTSPCEVLSLNAALELLPEAGHAVTISDYFKILQDAMLFEPLERYSALGVRKRSSIPCLLVRDNGLVTSLTGRSFETTKDQNGFWQSLIRNSVGINLARQTSALADGLHYWKDGEQRVDFVATVGKRTLAVSCQGRRSAENAGLKAFLKKFPDATAIAIAGMGGDFSLEGFFNARMDDMLANASQGWGAKRFCAVK